MIKLPQNRWLQYNRSSWLGDLDSTFNCDTSTEEGVLAFTRTKTNVNESLVGGNFAFTQAPFAFAEMSDKMFLLAPDLHWGSNKAQNRNTLQKITGFRSDIKYGDLQIFNGKLYVSLSGNVRRSNNGIDSFTSLWTTLTDNTPHLMTVYGDRLYITDNFNNILSANQAEAIATLGDTSTIGIPVSDNDSISFMQAGTDRIWVGTISSNNQDSFLFEWDGESSLTSRKYKVPGGVVAGTIHNNAPYIVNSKGQLMTVSGSAVREVATFPLENGFDAKPSGFSFTLGEENKQNRRNIHPNGMISTGEHILILIQTTSRVGSLANKNPKAMSGVWEFNPQNRSLSHKYSMSDSLAEVADSNGALSDNTAFLDYGVGDLLQVGAIYQLRGSKNSDDAGTIVMGAETRKDEATDSGPAVFIDEDVYKTERAGYFTTAKIPASEITDSYASVTLKFRKTSGTYFVKSRTTEVIPATASVNWITKSEFNTTEDLSRFVVGDEVEVFSGNGSGSVQHIKNIKKFTGTSVVELDEPIDTVDVGQTAFVKIENYKLSGSYNGDLQHAEFPISKDDIFLQLKVYYKGVERGEVYEILINNRRSKKV